VDGVLVDGCRHVEGHFEGGLELFENKELEMDREEW
jgi:coenzyme F420-reducing hydrogenase delta subunit